MEESNILTADIRSTLGTGPARALRLEHKVPAIIYGAGKKELAIAIQEKEITRLYRKPGFSTNIITIEVEGKKHRVLPKSIDLHPTTDLVWHADFIYLNQKTQKVDVPIIYANKEKAVGVKKGGFFNIIKRKISLICPVDNIPANITLDVVNVAVGVSLHASKLTLPEGSILNVSPRQVIASITGRGGKADATDEGASGDNPAGK